MEVEVMAAGGAVDDERRDCHGGRQQDDSGADEAAPAGWLLRSHRQNLRPPERFEEETKEGHANPLYQYSTVEDRASKITVPRAFWHDWVTPDPNSIAAGYKKNPVM